VSYVIKYNGNNKETYNITYIICVIVVSVCTIVSLWHRVSLAPLFGSVC